MPNHELIKQALDRGVEKIYPTRGDLEKLLLSGKKMRLYCGFDPTAVSLHIGHAIQIRKLSHFQKLGHEVIFLIGDFTGMIGDPTDKTKARKQMTRKEVLTNAKYYKKQAGKILSFSGSNPAKLMYNSQWNDKLCFVDLIKLAANFTVGQMIVRDMFQDRIKDKKPVYLHEFLYPLAQAYDSVAMDVDLEVGGNDQTFNMLCGRDLMKAVKGKEKFVLANKLLSDAGGAKMGKTEGNAINLDTPADQMYGRIMSWPDGIIVSGMELLTDLPMDKVGQIQEEVNAGKMNPRDAKALLAREVVTIHHNQLAAQKAEKEFERIFRQKKQPSQIFQMEIAAGKYSILGLLKDSGLVISKSQAKRLIEQGGIKINGKKISDWQAKIEPTDGMVIQAGKRGFVKVKVS